MMKRKVLVILIASLIVAGIIFVNESVWETDVTEVKTIEFDTEVPFGVNNPFSSDKELTGERLTDLGVIWVSDHFPRRRIEKIKDGKVIYDFSEIDGKINEYGKETNSNAWIIINVESKYEFGDGKQVNWGRSKGKYVPYGPESYEAYGKFLKELVNYSNTQIPDWKVKYWSIDNEHASLYVPVFCSDELKKLDKNEAKKCGKEAAEAYANIVVFSYETIKETDPDAKIVFGGPGGGTSDAEYNYYYKEALMALKEKQDDGYFDFFDYHNFNTFDKYKINGRNKDLEFFRQMLEDTGFSDKPIIIKAGATHSGMDKIAKNKRLHQFQTEQEQAEYLFKRSIYHIGNGVELILWGTIREDEDLSGTFSYNGLIYNGIPKKWECDPTGQFPCPDPGDGVKKLSYYTYKKLIETIKGSDYDNIETIEAGVDNVYVYKFIKNDKPIYVVWWDYWEESQDSKTIALNVGDLKSVKITEAIPDAESGMDLNENEYPNFFKTEIKTVTANGKVMITLKKNPVFVEKK